MGELDNTLVIYMAGDNGSSAEGGLNGLLNEMTFFNAIPEPLDRKLAALDTLGSDQHYNHFPAGWAWAMDTPFQWTKQIASHFGGTRNGVAISWPKRIKARGEVRDQFHHVIDIAPTILEVVGVEAPAQFNGVAQKPIEGVSMAYTFDDADAEDRRTTQYFEMLGNQGIYHDGWMASAIRGIPWLSENRAGRPARHAVGAVPRRRGLHPGQRSGQARAPRSSTSWSSSSSPRRPGTTCCRWTIARRND